MSKIDDLYHFASLSSYAVHLAPISTTNFSSSSPSCGGKSFPFPLLIFDGDTGVVSTSISASPPPSSFTDAPTEGAASSCVLCWGFKVSVCLPRCSISISLCFVDFESTGSTSSVFGARARLFCVCVRVCMRGQMGVCVRAQNQSNMQ